MLKTLLRMQTDKLMHTMFRNQSRKSKAMRVVFALLMVYAYGCIGLVMGMLFHTLLEPFLLGDIMWLYYGLAGILAFCLSFIFSIFLSSSMLYQAKDNELLLSMPIPVKYILLCRVAVIWLTEFVSCLLVLLPAGIVHWVFARPDPGCILRFVAGCITLPFLCTALSCLVGYLVTRITAKMRRKNIASLVISLLFLGVYFFGYSRAGVYVQKLLAHTGQIAQSIRQGVFPAYCFGMGIAQGGMDLVWWIMCAMIPFALMFMILKRSFIRLCTGIGGAAKQKFDKNRAFRSGTLSSALLKKELRRLASSANYMLNACMGVLMAIVLPAVFLMKPDISAIFSGLLGDPAAIYALILCFCCSMILVSAPSVSLEGKGYWITRSMPVDAYRILMAKVQAHLLIALPAGMIGSAISCAACKPDLYTALMLFLLPAAMNLYVAFAGVCINLRFPRLDWTSEAMVIKQGMSVGITMLSGNVLIIAMAVIYVFLPRSISLDVYMLLWSLLLMALCVCFYRDLRTNGAKRYETLT